MIDRCVPEPYSLDHRRTAALEQAVDAVLLRVDVDRGHEAHGDMASTREHVSWSLKIVAADNTRGHNCSSCVHRQMECTLFERQQLIRLAFSPPCALGRERVITPALRHVIRRVLQRAHG